MCYCFCHSIETFPKPKLKSEKNDLFLGKKKNHEIFKSKKDIFELRRQDSLGCQEIGNMICKYLFSFLIIETTFYADLLEMRAKT